MPLDLENSSLAINGGTPIRSQRWLDNFTFGSEEKEAVIKAIDTGYLSKFEGSWTPDPPFSFYGGPFIQELEKLWCEYYQITHSVSVNSATSGLYAALGALDIGYGDEVIVSPSTMTACAVGPLIYGAIPIFADIERETGAIDPISFEKVITERTAAIIIVHQFGIPANMDKIMKIAKHHGIKVIEDCAQAHGAKYKGQFVGTIGDIGVFSLNVNKSIQCGEGGICITHDNDLAFRLQLIRNHGEAVTGPAGVKHLTNLVGFNYRLTELQAAVAIEQLKKLDWINDKRIYYVKKLNDALNSIPFLETIGGRENCQNTFYTWPILYRPEIGGSSVSEVHEALNAEGMYFLRGYSPLYLQPLYQNKQAFKHGMPFSSRKNKYIKTNYFEGACPVAEEMRESILIKEYVRHPSSEEDIEDIILAFKKLESVLDGL